jgi:hypothetical protein
MLCGWHIIITAWKRELLACTHGMQGFAVFLLAGMKSWQKELQRLNNVKLDRETIIKGDTIHKNRRKQIFYMFDKT